MRRVLAVLALAGCGAAARPAAAPVAKGPKHTEISPLELLVRGADAVKAPRARLIRRTRAWLSRDEPLIEGDAVPVDEVVAIQQTRDKGVRVLAEYDDARLLLWIPRRDLATVIVHPTAVEVGGDGTIGVTAGPGATVVVRAVTTTGTRVTITGDGLSVTGEVPADAIGDVWDPVAAGDDEGESTSSLEGGTAIKAAADRRAATLAITTGYVPVKELAVHGGWTEIETTGPLLRVHGMVPTAALAGSGLGYLMGDLLGETYGLTDTDSIHVANGTCLYDGVDGKLVGVTTTDRDRYAFGTDDPAWIRVRVDTQWGTSDPAVHVANDGGELSVETCTAPITSP